MLTEGGALGQGSTGVITHLRPHCILELRVAAVTFYEILFEMYNVVNLTAGEHVTHHQDF